MEEDKKSKEDKKCSFLLKTEPARSSVHLPSGGHPASFHSGCLTSDLCNIR